MSLTALPMLLLIPPINLLVFALVGAALHRRRGGRVLMAVSLVGLLLFALPAVSGCLIVLLETGFDKMPVPALPAQAIVILSADQQRVITPDGVGWHVGGLTLEREAAGVVLARQTHLPILVTGGVIRDHAPPLAEQMAANLDQAFLTQVQWREDRSVDTWQNAVFSAAILRAQGIDRIYLVTHAWHMRRALLAFRRAGLVATPRVVQRDAVPDLRTVSFLPSARGWQESYYAMHELLGWAWYAVRP